MMNITLYDEYTSLPTNEENLKVGFSLYELPAIRAFDKLARKIANGHRLSKKQVRHYEALVRGLAL